MKHLLVLGAGTAGTIVANRMRSRLATREWTITVVDPDPIHLYQPGLLFLPFGDNLTDDLVRPREGTLHAGIDWKPTAVEHVDVQRKLVQLASGERLAWDLLVIATGCRLRPELTEGLLDEGWQQTAFDFYTLDGATRLASALRRFEGGRLVLNVVEMPIKCPVAPLEFLFLADAHFRSRGLRGEVELKLVTPLDGAFTKPIASRRLGHLLEEKGIAVEAEFSTGRVDGAARKLVSWDEREVGYDLLVTVPTHGGAAFVERSGLGNELGFVPTDQRSLAAKAGHDVFVVGDATDVPASKAGSVAHFEAETLVENLTLAAAGKELVSTFDGHANCFVETGDGKALLIDFNYDTEPLPGKYPLPGVGPFSLLEESRQNHRGKLAFQWLYWNGLLPGHALPVPAHMSLLGKERPEPT